MNAEQWIKKVEQLGFTVVKTKGDCLEAELRDLKIWTQPISFGADLISAASFRFNYHYSITSCYCLTVEETLKSLLSEITRTMQNVQYEVAAIAKMLAGCENAMNQDAPKGFRRVSNDEIEPLSPVDSQFLEIAQGATFRSTVLPSGSVTPDYPMVAKGGVLVEVKE